jgi:serine/threonine protein kinase
LDDNTIRKYFKELLDAVEYIHSLGVVHKDIKPLNIGLYSD